MKEKKAINYYASFYDVSKDLNQKQFYEFNMAIFKVMFFEEHIDSIKFQDAMLNILWKSVKHSILSSVKGYCDKKNIPYDTMFEGAYQPPCQPPYQQEQEKEQEKEKVSILAGYDLSENEISLFNEYFEIRRKLKAQNTDSIVKRLVSKYFEFGRNPKVIENAIVNNWKDFYQLKDTKVDAQEKTKKRSTYGY